MNKLGDFINENIEDGPCDSPVKKEVGTSPMHERKVVGIPPNEFFYYLHDDTVTQIVGEKSDLWLIDSFLVRQALKDCRVSKYEMCPVTVEIRDNMAFIGPRWSDGKYVIATRQQVHYNGFKRDFQRNKQPLIVYTLGNYRVKSRGVCYNYVYVGPGNYVYQEVLEAECQSFRTSSANLINTKADRKWLVSDVNQDVLPKVFREQKKCAICMRVLYKKNRTLCPTCFKRGSQKSEVVRGFDMNILNGTAFQLPGTKIQFPVESLLDRNSYVLDARGNMVPKTLDNDLEDCDIFDPQCDEKTFRRKAYARRDRKFKSKTIPKNLMVDMFLFEDCSISFNVPRVSPFVARFASIFKCSYEQALQQVLVYSSNLLFNKGFAGVSIHNVEKYIVGVYRSQKARYFSKDITRNEFVNKQRFLIKNFEIWAPCFCVDKFMLRLDHNGVEQQWSYFDLVPYILKKNNLTAQPQSFMDTMKSIQGWMNSDTVGDIVAWVTNAGNKVMDLIINPAEAMLKSVGFEVSSGLIIKGLLAVLIAGLLLSVMISLGMAFNYVYSIACSICSMMYDFVPSTDYSNVATPQSFSNVACTMLCLFGCAITGGSKFDLFKSIGPSRAVGQTCDSLIDLAIPFLDKLFEHFTGVPGLLQGGELNELQQLVDDIWDFVSEEEINKRILIDKEKSQKCRELFLRSAQVRKKLIKYTKFSPHAHREFENCCRKLERLYDKCIYSREDRQVPIFIVLEGVPNQGKSTIIEYLINAVYTQLRKKFPDDPKFKDVFNSGKVFARKAANKYWEGYAGQWACMYNEIFPEKDPALRVETSVELMAAVEGSNYPLNMAGVELKGTTFFESELIIATTNVASFVDIGLYEPKAFLRRIHFSLNVERAESLKEDNSNISSCWKLTKSDTPDSQYMIGLSPFVKDNVFGISQLVDYVVSEYIFRRNSVKHTTNASTIDWDSEIAKGNPFKDLKKKEFVPCGSCSDGVKRCTFHGCTHVQCPPPSGFRTQCLKCNAQCQMFGTEVLNWWKDEEVTGFEDNLFTIEKCQTVSGNVDFVNDSKALADEYRERLLRSDMSEFEFIDTIWSEIGVDELVWKPETLEHLFLYMERNELKVKLLCEESFSFKTLQFVATMKDHESSFGRWVRKSFKGFRSYFNSLRLSLLTVMCIPYDWFCAQDFSTPSAVWEFVKENPKISAGLTLALSVLGAAGVYFLIKTLRSLISFDDDICDKEETAAEITPETVEQAICQSDTKAMEKMRTKYAKRRIGNRPLAVAQSAGDHMSARMCKFTDNIRYSELISDSGRTVGSSIWFGTPNQFFIPRHALEVIGWTKMVIYGVDGKSEYSYIRSQLEIKNLSDRDGAIVRIKSNSIPTGCKNLLGSLMPQVVSTIPKPYRVTRTFDLEKNKYLNIMLQGTEAQWNSGVLTSSSPDMDIKITYKGYYVVVNGGGNKGACSSPWITIEPRYQNTPIFGMHIAQLGLDSIVCPLYPSDFQDYEALSTFNAIMQCFDPHVSALVEGTSACEQATLKIHPPYKTVFVKTELSDALKIYNEKIPAVLNDEALDLALDKYQRFPLKSKPQLLHDLESDPDAMFKGFAKFDPNYVWQLLTAEDCVFGNSDLGIDPMDMNTSPGYPDVQQGRTKRSWVVLDRDRRALHPVFKHLVEERIAEWRQGNFSPQVVVDTLKDELRPRPRVSQKKTRLFCVGNLVDFVCVKMIVGHVISYLKNHRFGSTCAIGVNPHSYDWSLLYQRIFKFGRDTVVGGDLESMDISTQRFMGDIMFAFFRYFIPSLEFDKVLFNLFKAVCFNIVTTIHICNFGTYLYTKGNSSGNYLTGFYNSLCSHVYLYTCFRRLCPGLTFEDHVSMAIYGDDNLASVSLEVAHLFNNMTIPKVMKEMFGVGMTDPNKNEFTEPFLRMEDQTFLSRSFVLNDLSDTEVPNYYVKAPLEKSSIFGCLHWVRSGGETPMNVKLQQNLDVFCLEMYHYPEREARVMRNLVQAALVQSKLNYKLKSEEEVFLLRTQDYNPETFFVY